MAATLAAATAVVATALAVEEAEAAVAAMVWAVASRKVAASHARIQAIHKAGNLRNTRHATRMHKPHVHATRRSATMTPSPPAMSPPASPLPVNPLAATAATTVAVAAVAVQPAAAADARVALVLGATGLVGQEILALLLADKTYTAVHCVGRRAPLQNHPKLVVHLTDSLSAFKAPAVDDVFIALGTTIKVAGSQQAFRAIDFDTVLAVARSACEAGARRLGIVSAMGADAKSSVFYNRVKGQMEDAVGQLAFDSTVFARPSLLSGNRKALAQSKRPGEQLAIKTMALFKALIPRNYRAISGANVAGALVSAVKSGQPGRRVLLSGQMQNH